MYLNEYILLCSVMMMYVDDSRKNEWIPQGKTMQHALRISGKGNITPFRMLPNGFRDNHALKQYLMIYLISYFDSGTIEVLLAGFFLLDCKKS